MLPRWNRGIGMYEKIKAALAAAGARLQIGFPVIEARLADGRCVEVVTAGAARPYRWQAQQYVLATGGIASGGIATEASGGVRESIFNLPLAGLPAGAPERFRPGYFEAQPMSQVGLEVDMALRPVDGQGQAVIANLRAAGALLAHAEPWREKSGDGISLATGYAAAEAVLEAMRD
jgi:glycerol-3-phosphate dehydrogenase subunit B